MKTMYIYICLGLIASCHSQKCGTSGDRDNGFPEGALVDRQRRKQVNNRPIIGVLAQEKDQDIPIPRNNTQYNYSSYIAASYVKSLEACGARVVPILIGKDRGYYKQLMTKINGVLFPGGEALFEKKGGYADAGQHIYEIALHMNDDGDYFPIHGTCLGFQYLVVLALGREKHKNMTRCRSETNKPLIFTSEFETSKMFSGAPRDIVKMLASQNITVNMHHFCVYDKDLEEHNLTEDWQVTSYVLEDTGNSKFIASIENKRYPFYGSQFHPEKSSFEWNPHSFYAHSVEAIKANHYFSEFFVAECRKNSHSFSDVKEENEYLIYNFSPAFTYPIGSVFYETYLFP